MKESQTNPKSHCPWGVWPGRLLVTLFALMFVCIVFDREAGKILHVLAWITLVVAAVTDRHGRRQYVLPIALVMAALMGLTAGAAWLWGDLPAAAMDFIKYQIGIIWLAVLWIAAPIFLNPLWHDKTESISRRNACRWATALGAILILFAMQATVSAGASLFPKVSMELLGAELLPYVGLVVIIKRFSWCTKERWLRTGLRATWILLVLACLGMAATEILALSSGSMADWLLRHQFFRIDSYAPNSPRLQFLFEHHNRAGFFAACSVFLCASGAWGGRGWKILGIAGVTAAAFALPFTLTRGALLAAALGMILFAALGMLKYRKGRWALLAAVVLAGPLMWTTLPGSYRAHIVKITNPANYHENSNGSIGARLVMWDTAAGMIGRRPALGFGYGYENFESAARLDHPDRPAFFEGASHAHNHWLETAAETGLPGFCLLFALTLARIGGLAYVWWKSSKRGYDFAWLLLLWLCLECAIQLYGMTNYTLRRNLGFLTYWIWGGSALLVIMTARAEMCCAGETKEPLDNKGQ